MTPSIPPSLVSRLHADGGWGRWAPLGRAGLAGLAGLAFAALATTAQTTKVAPLQGPAAVLELPAVAPQRPERSLLLAITRAGDRLVAVGEQGVVALSDDHGQRWRPARAVPTSTTLTAVRFANAQQGWAVGHLGVVLHTQDGGDTWTRQLDGTRIGLLALAQSRADPDSLPATEAQRLSEDGPDKPLLDLQVADPRQLSVIGAYNLALSSSDGGNTWQIDSKRYDNERALHLYARASTPAGSYAVGEQGLLLKSNGQRFEAVKSPYEGSLFGVLASGAGVLVHGLRGHAFISRDAGASWQRAELPGSGASINASTRLADGRLALADQAGGIYLSSDDGLHFTRVPFAWGAPITGIVEAADGSLVATSVVGITSVPKSAAGSANATPSRTADPSPANRKTSAP